MKYTPTFLTAFLLGIFLASLSSFQPVIAQEAAPTLALTPTSAGVINAVNNLRLKNGLPGLTTHPVLMQVAEWEVNAMASGLPGHSRPAGLTLGQWLLSLGYPLSGDLSLDGYRSENVVSGSDLTAQDAVNMWLGDEEHTNTMLSPYRSDIGAGVAMVKDEWGSEIYYYVLETALRTKSGQMQSDAKPILTAIAENQTVIYGDATQAVLALEVPQYIVPISRATARPDGDVIHEVKNGQTLWAIAVNYGVKIDQIRRLNNLPSNDIYIGQKLLVQKSATQPVVTPVSTHTPTTQIISMTPTPSQTITSTPLLVQVSKVDEKGNGLSIFAVGFTVVVLVVGFAVLIRKIT